MIRKIKIDFDTNNRDAILRCLMLQQSHNLALKEVSDLFGIMTFEPTYDTVRYAVRKKAYYNGDCPDVDGWCSKGDIGPYRIFSTCDPTIADYPLEEITEHDMNKKSTKAGLIQLLFYLVLGALSIGTFASKYFGSTAALFEMQISDILEPVSLILSAYLILKKIINPKAFTKPIRNPSWFKLYVLPWIYLPLIILMIIGGVYFIMKLEKHPANEVPYQAPLDTAIVQYTLFGQIITARDEFMYISHSKEITNSLYEEALQENDDIKGRWFSPTFWNFNDYTELDTSDYENIDRAMLMDENTNSYDLQTQGVMVLIDNRLYGIAFDKEATTVERILKNLNLE